MTVQKSNNAEKKESGLNPVAIAVTGAVLGAGAAIAGAVLLQDKNNRKRAKEVLANVQVQAGKYLAEVKKDIQSKKQTKEKSSGKKSV